jgi:2'-5' RNA ligase
MFVALVPPAEAVEHLEEFLAPRREAASFRWATPEQFHVTLAFLAEVEERRLDELVERLGRAGKRRTPFAARIAGGGAFPNAGRARVVWAGLDLDDHGRTELTRLATGARAAASKSGIAVDGQRFKAHVTLARLGRPAEVSNWVRLLDGYRGPEWTADRIELVASYLGEGPRGRPRYETVAEVELLTTPRS